MKRGFGRKSGKRKYGGNKLHGSMSGMGLKYWYYNYENGQWRKKRDPKIKKPLKQKILRLIWL